MMHLRFMLYTYWTPLEVVPVKAVLHWLWVGVYTMILGYGLMWLLCGLGGGYNTWLWAVVLCVIDFVVAMTLGRGLGW